MKLCDALGVAAPVGAEPELPLTPPELPTTLAGPLPFGHFGASGLSSVEADGATRPLPVGDTV